MITFEEWKQIVKGTPDAEIPDVIKSSLRDKELLHIFGRYFFPHMVKGDYETPDAHLDLIAEISKPKDSGIIFPRGFAKSTWEKIDTIHDIVYGLEPVILYVSATIKDASFHFESIKGELENNDLLRDFYGDLVPSDKIVGRKWTNLHFETLNGVNLVARGRNKGRGVNIRNQRPTKIIVDDVEDDEQVSSAEQREKLKNWLYSVIFLSKASNGGRIKMIGTVLHMDAMLLEFYRTFGGIYRAAIEDGKSIWPEEKSLEWLEQQRKIIGTRRFALEMLNQPTNADLAHVKPAWIDNNLYTMVPKGIFPMIKVITLDPQAGEKQTSDEYAVTCVGYYDRDPHRYVLEQKAGRVSQFEQAKAVVKMWLRHRSARIVGIEKVMNQTAVYQILLDWRTGRITFGDPTVDESDRNIPIAAISPEGKDKLARLQVHEPAFERGEIHLRPEMRDLREQVMYLGTKVIAHDDRADSLIMALDQCQRRVLVKGADGVYNSNTETIAGNLHAKKF